MIQWIDRRLRIYRARGRPPRVWPQRVWYFLAYGLVKGAYIGTEALATVVMHVTKLIAYRQAAVLSATALVAGVAIGPIMILGSYTGKRIVDRISERVFVFVIEVTMVTAGLLFLVRGQYELVSEDTPTSVRASRPWPSGTSSPVLTSTDRSRCGVGPASVSGWIAKSTCSGPGNAARTGDREGRSAQCAFMAPAP